MVGFGSISKMTLGATCILQLLLLLVTSLPGQPGTMKWSLQTGGAVQGSPAIGPEGVIYVGSQDRKLYAINPDGTEKWTFTGDQPFLEPPAIGEDHTIYAAANNGTLYALNPDGSLKWTFVPAEAGPPSEMALAEDGTIYYAVNRTYYAVNPDGSQFWTITRAAESSVNGISIELLSIGVEKHQAAFSSGTWLTGTPLTYLAPW